MSTGRCGWWESFCVMMFGKRQLVELHNVFGDVRVEFIWRGNWYYVDDFGDIHCWSHQDSAGGS